jgi:hypothetical protein
VSVSPGLRANNFYDNFRSFSRQNQFSLPAMQAVAAASSRGAVRLAPEPLPANNTTAGQLTLCFFTVTSFTVAGNPD